MSVREYFNTLISNLNLSTDKELAEYIGVTKEDIGMWVYRDKISKNGIKVLANHGFRYEPTNINQQKAAEKLTDNNKDNLREKIDADYKDKIVRLEGKLEAYKEIIKEQSEKITLLESQITELKTVQPPAGIRSYKEYELEDEVGPSNIKYETEKSTYKMPMTKAAATPIIHRRGSSDEHSDLDSP